MSRDNLLHGLKWAALALGVTGLLAVIFPHGDPALLGIIAIAAIIAIGMRLG